MRNRLPPGLSALLELGLMFLPGIPAYIWVWPNLKGTALDVFQILVYFYILVGTIFIGRRRWGWSALGVNRQGIGLSLACGLALLLGRQLVLLSVDWGIAAPSYGWFALLGQALYYIGLVGLVEELLFRGLVYRALEEWRDVRWAIWGSSLGFVLWHIFGQGLLVGATTFVLGLIFALMRWRAGGIIGLILVHGLYDLQGVLQISGSTEEIMGRPAPQLLYPWLLRLGFALMLLTPVYLWKIHPWLLSRFARSSV
jgi:membrane protease YdiL (CAAX protease family)